jgi:hypothetical protein
MAPSFGGFKNGCDPWEFYTRRKISFLNKWVFLKASASWSQVIVNSLVTMQMFIEFGSECITDAFE